MSHADDKTAKIPPPQPKKGYKKDIATKSLDNSRLFSFFAFNSCCDDNKDIKHLRDLNSGKIYTFINWLFLQGLKLKLIYDIIKENLIRYKIC